MVRPARGKTLWGKATTVCGEGVYGTRPWRISSEGDTRTVIRGFTEEQAPWTSADYRFTQKGNTVYAFMMRTPESRVAVIKSFQPEEKVKSVRLLGVGNLTFSQNFGVVTVQLPEKMPLEAVNCLAVEL